MRYIQQVLVFALLLSPYVYGMQQNTDIPPVLQRMPDAKKKSLQFLLLCLQKSGMRLPYLCVENIANNLDVFDWMMVDTINEITISKKMLYNVSAFWCDVQQPYFLIKDTSGEFSVHMLNKQKNILQKHTGLSNQYSWQQEVLKDKKHYFVNKDNELIQQISDVSSYINHASIEELLVLGE